jgi:hypothetical protein
VCVSSSHPQLVSRYYKLYHTILTMTTTKPIGNATTKKPKHGHEHRHKHRFSFSSLSSSSSSSSSSSAMIKNNFVWTVAILVSLATTIITPATSTWTCTTTWITVDAFQWTLPSHRRQQCHLPCPKSRDTSLSWTGNVFSCCTTTTTMTSRTMTTAPSSLTKLRMSDVPRDGGDNDNNNNNNNNKEQKKNPKGTWSNNNDNHDNHERDEQWNALVASYQTKLQKLVPPPMEDPFTVMGDLASLLWYAWTSHSLSNWIVQRILANSETLAEAVQALDPDGEVLTTANSYHQMSMPVWLDDPHLVDNSSAHWTTLIATTQVQDKFLTNHWGPLFATPGLAGVVLCSSWLVAGWLTRGFLLRHTLECSTSHVLVRTIGIWWTSLLLLAGAAYTTNHVVLPIVWHCQDYLLLQQQHQHDDVVVGGTVVASWNAAVALSGQDPTRIYAASQIPNFFTYDDLVFCLDSVSVLLAWRYIVSSFWGYQR